ncbi:MAG: hypothetical protein HUU37_07750, partial [Bdellovibrionales bacterium]|nr:hypothetical protein [Bdellovibrionales bacterium]
MIRSLAALVAAGLLSACGSTMGLRAKVRDEVTHLNFRQAERELTQPRILEDAKNRLLTLLDLGLVAHYAGEFEKSNRFLFAAKRVHRELFTQSVTESVSTLFVNDNSATYAGMDYEISLAHYYAAMNFFFLSRAEKVEPWEIPELKAGNDVVFPRVSEE